VVLYILLMALGGLAWAQTRTDLQGIVPGNELGWEIQELRASVVVSKPTLLNLQIYSPGFDPQDYRRGLKGQPELGDERYDGGKGSLLSEFTLQQDRKVLAQATYGVEPHRWVVFFRGALQPGIYQLTSRFIGLGKNAFRYRLQTSVPGAAELLVDPTLQLYDIRRPGGVLLANVRGGNWLEPFVLEVSSQVLPLKVGFYDEDGPKELEARVRLPNGSIQPRSVSGDKAWAYYQVSQPGIFRFGFRQPPSAQQYSNTIGFRVDACMEVGRDHFKVVPPRPITALAVDPAGKALEVPLHLEGQAPRTVRLDSVPAGYRFVRLETEGGVVNGPRAVEFGCAGGSVRFVLEKTPPPEHELSLSALLVTPQGEQPFEMTVQVEEQTVRLKEGAAQIRLAQAEPTILAQIPGARVERQERYREEGGVRRIAEVQLRVYPEVGLSLSSSTPVLKVGEEATLTLSAHTEFPAFLPAELSLELPPCLEPLDTPQLTTPVSASHPGTLSVRVRATCRGEFTPTAHLQPWQQVAQTSLRVLQAATFTLRKEALQPQVNVGEQAQYRITVQNTGDEAGEVRVRDGLAAGLWGSPLDQIVRLEPGQAKAFELSATVTAEAPETLTNTATLLNARGETLAEAQASLRVLRPLAKLTRTLDKHLAVPGEAVTVTLRVTNEGQAPLSYALTDTPPEWLETAAEPEFKGQLEPGQSAIHTYTGTVRFGAEAEGRFRAELRSNGGTLEAPDALRRVWIGLEKSVSPDKVVLGGEAEFVLRVHNPTDHPLRLELQEAPDPNLNLQLPSDLGLELAPGEGRELRLKAQPQKVGGLENQVTALVNGVPASGTAKAVLRVLPVLEPVRISTVRLEFSLQGSGQRLLLTHQPPAGAQYEPGSARLDGQPFPDPRLDDQGRLYFELPYQPRGVLSYQLRHRDRLPELEPSTLTLQVGDREVFLQGQVPFSALGATHPLEVRVRDGFIQEPLPGTLFRADKAKVVVQTPYGLEVQLLINGVAVDSKSLGQATYDPASGIQRLEYYGLPLQPGRNQIELQTAAGSDRVEVFLAGNPVRLEVRPLKLLADGRTPLEFEILALDANGLPSGFGPLTLQTSGEPLEPDAFPDLSGYQLLLKEGRAVLRLKPLAAPSNVRLQLAFGELSANAAFYVLGKQTSFWQFQGSVGVRLADGGQGFALGRGYLETPLGNGILRGALDGSLAFEQGQPQVNGGLNRLPDPTGAFPLTGAGTEAQPALRSEDPLALRYDEERFSLGYYAGSLALAGLPDLPQGTVLRAETRGDLSAQGFLGWLPVASRTEEIVPDGTRIYSLSGAAEPGSETVLLMIGASSVRLEPLKDYVLDGLSGLLTLSRPLWPSTADFQPVRLVVSYAPLGGARELGYGAGVRAKLGGFNLGGSAAFLPGSGWNYGLEAGFQNDHFSLAARYLQGAEERFGLEASGQEGRLETAANLSVSPGVIVQGSARVGYALSPADKLSLEHTANADSTTHTNQTGLLYIRTLSPSFSVGAGLGYLWEAASLAGLGRLGYQSGAFSSELTHAQPFSGLAQATTRLRTRLAFDSNTALEGDLLQTWGQGLSGSLGLKQKLAGSNLALDYQLPGASGEGNRARFGLETPLPLDERWGLNLSAGLERDLNSGTNQAALGLATRYKTATFSATLGGETAWDGSQVKVVLRGGAAGQLDAQQTLSLDTTYQVTPTPTGSFTVAYALRGAEVSLLTYHRLISAPQSSPGPTGVLEGSLAASYHPNLAFQLRPSLAYRSVLGDPDSTTFQVGLGGNYYFSERWGLGATAYYQFQPSTGSSATALGLEGSFRVVEGLWFNLGYVLGGFQGLTPDTRPGIYLRLDFLTGGP